MADNWIITATVFMICAVTLSCYAVLQHLCNFSKPYLQRYIIRILCMVPIYSINAWMAMIFPSTGTYLDCGREMYEAFAVYSFSELLFNFLKYDTNLQQYIDHKPRPNHIFPFCLLPTCAGGSRFMIRCKHGILQYVIVRPITTFIAFASKLGNFYGEGESYNPFSGYTYPVLLIVNNISQITAMYCLVIFYNEYKHELAPLRPLGKFLSIKLVIFFSFFQSVLITGLMELDFIEKMFQGLFPDLDSKLEVGRKLQEFLICFDMLIAAIGHQFAFSHLPFKELDENRLFRQVGSHQKSNTCCEALRNIFDFSDEKTDVQDHLYYAFLRFKRSFRPGRSLPSVVMLDSDEAYEYTPLTTLNVTRAGSSKGSYSALPSAI